MDSCGHQKTSDRRAGPRVRCSSVALRRQRECDGCAPRRGDRGAGGRAVGHQPDRGACPLPGPLPGLRRVPLQAIGQRDRVRLYFHSREPATAAADTPPLRAHGEVIVLTGPPGAGKSTVARLLAETLSPSVHLHSDDFWHFIRQGRIAPYRPEAHRQNEVVINVLAQTAFGYAAGGYDVIRDGIIGPWFIDVFRTASTSKGIRLHYVVLRPDEPTTLAPGHDPRHRRAHRPRAGALAISAVHQPGERSNHTLWIPPVWAPTPPQPPSCTALPQGTYRLDAG